MLFHRTGLAGFFMAGMTILSACSDTTSVASGQEPGPVAQLPSSAGNSAPVINPQDGQVAEDPTTAAPVVSDGGQSVPETVETGTSAASPVDQGTPVPVVLPVDEGIPVVSPDDQGTPVVSPVDQDIPVVSSPVDTGTTDPSEPLNAASATGSDISGVEDDSPTLVETQSLVGPFLKDTSRGASPPSAPQNLTLLLSAENWLEFSWAPATDDQSVEAYEIYRDGQLLSTVRGDTGYEFDYRSWLSTSYIDCNYTRYTNCDVQAPMPGATYSYTVIAIDNEGMRSESSAPAQFTLAQRSTSPVDLSAYSKVFDENFDGDRLDRDQWKTVLPWGAEDIINRETQYFVNIFGNNPPAYDPFVFTGETLQITGIDTPANLLESANNQPYLSGVLTTSDNFEMTYGYVEMSAKVAGGEGLLSTFFLFNQDYEKNKPEIDILEYIGSRPNKAYQTYHYFDSNRARFFSGEKHSSPTMEFADGPDLSSGFHTYGVLWEAGLIIWYIDGVEIRRITGPRVSDEPMNIIAQLVIGSEWIGAPTASQIPAIYEIDYIHAWQK